MRGTLRCAANISIRIYVNSESIWVDILKGRENLTVGIQYRLPNLGREDTNSLLQEIGRASRNKNVWILGDYNFRRIDWEGVQEIPNKRKLKTRKFGYTKIRNIGQFLVHEK